VRIAVVELLVPAGTPALRLGEFATVADEGEILVVDVRTYLPTSAVFDQRRRGLVEIECGHVQQFGESIGFARVHPACDIEGGAVVPNRLPGKTDPAGLRAHILSVR